MNPTKRIVFIIIFSIAGLFLLITFIAYLKRDEIKNLVVRSINEKLNRKVDVGEISFSILKNFPYASVDFENVVIHEAKDFVTTGHVLNAGNISLLFSLKSIFNKQYTLNKIVITNAALNLQTDNDGNNNYEIWKQSSDKPSSTDSIHLELQNVIFENTDVLYYNNRKQQDISFLITTGSLQGDFKSESYVLNSDASLQNASVIIESVRYLTDVDCHLQLALEVDNGKGQYVFRESELQLADLVLSLSGKIQDLPDYLDLDLKIVSPAADLPSLLSLIPEKYRGETIGYNYSGKIEFGGTIKGRSGKNFTPVAAFNFKSIGVNLNPKNTPYHLSNMNGTGYFTNRKNKTNPVTYLRLEKFSTLLEGKTIHVDLEVENFNHPKLNLTASGEADLNAFSKFYKPDTIETISGIAFADIAFNGIADEKSTYQSSGSVRFENVNFKLRQKPTQFSDFNGMIHLRGNDVIVENINGRTGNSDFSLNGSFNNLMAFMLTENQKLNILATLKSDRIDLNELMAKDKATSAADTVYKIDFSDKLKFHADVTINELTFNKFIATSIKGTIGMESKVLTTRDLDFSTAEGTVRLKGIIDTRPVNHLLINYDALVNNLNINKLFTEMGNFGQTVLIDNNIKGKVSAEVQFRSSWSERLDIDENSIYVKSDITIENGELIDFEPMLGLSKYLKSADLKAIKFSTITNTIEIRNRKIFIPLMEIKSNALDITASGEHTFDNVVDYKLRLYLSQILGKKVKQQNTEFGTIEDDGLGRTMIYLSMKGPMDNPKFEWDRKSVEKKISEEVKNETKTFKSLLREEFGKKDPEKPVNPAKQENKKKDELQIDYDDEE